MKIYLVDSAIWSVGGLFLGYVLGRLENQAKLIITKVKHIEDVVEELEK